MEIVLPKKTPLIKRHQFYPLWKYVNGKRLEGEVIKLSDLIPLSEKPALESVNFFLKNRLDYDSELEDINFNKEKFERGYKDYYLKEYEYINRIIKEYPKSEFSKSFKKALNDKKISCQDLDNILGERTANQDRSKEKKLSDSDIEFEGIFELFSFSSDPAEENIKELREYINRYIQKFIDDNIKSIKDNIYKFSKQKEIILNRLQRHIERGYLDFCINYHNYIIESEAQVLGVESGYNESFLFVHTLAALEKQGYLSIESMNLDMAPLSRREVYNVGIKSKKKLLDLYDKQPKGSSFDEEKGVLTIRGNKIDKFRRGTNQYYFLKFIFKNKENKNKKWTYYELGKEAEDLSGKSDDALKGYPYAINNKIEAAIGVGDFFKTTNETVKINEQYLE